ncbi:MAG: hypothetical protein AAF579_14885, partial [Cyanobacteria bacterium P01_C01_bin.118]
MSLLPFLLALSSLAPVSLIVPARTPHQSDSFELEAQQSRSNFSNVDLTAQATGEVIPYIQEVRPLPGELDNIPV